MNNSDFSRLLTTNDRELVNELTKSRKRSGGGGGGEGAAKKKPRPDKGKGKGKGGKGKEKGGFSEAPKADEYRNRAEERRAGKGEYENIAAEFESLGEIAIDQSKFLGGDMEHTHLVKGLDFSLLSKVRTELTKKARADEVNEQRAAKKSGGHNKKRSFETQLGKRVYHSLVETLHPHHATFKKRLSNMSKALALGQRIRNAPTMFLPGRMAYEFDLDTDVSKAGTASDIPRTVYISKEDAPNVNQSTRVAPILPESVQLVTASFLRVAEAKKQRRKDRAAGVTATANYAVEKKVVVSKYKAKDADDDIFGDAGAYDPQAAAKEAAAKKAAAEGAKAKEAEKSGSKKPSYFADAGAEKYLKAPEGQLELDDVAVEEREEKPMPGDQDKTCTFEASDKFKGARSGKVFKLGAQGLGYYRDAFASASAAAKDPRDRRRDPREKREPAAGGKKRKGQAAKAGGEAPAADDAYGELFPDAGFGHAGVDTGENDSDEEEGVKSKIERLKKLAGKKVDGGPDSVSANKKPGGEAKKKKKGMSEGQQWEKIENIIKKGNHSSIEELEGRQRGKKRAPVAREIGTPAPF